jgi:competence protein ComEC
MKKLSFHSVSALVVAAIVAVGIVIGRKVDLSPAAWLSLLVVVFVVCSALFYLTKSHPNLLAYLSISLVALILVVGASKYRFDSSLHPVIPESLLKRQLTVVGRILESAETTENKTRFLFRLEEVQESQFVLPTRSNILVTVVRQRKDTADVPFTYGAKAELRGQLYRPSGERNPGEFNSRAYYEAQGITLLMRVRGYSNVAILDSTREGGVYDWLMRTVMLPVRFYILLLIDRTIGGEEGELLKGIFIGERGGIPYSTRVAFTNSGIAHLLAVSGSNVVVVLAFFTMFFSLLRVPRFANIFLTCVALLFYMVLTGSQPPIVRATIMTLVFLVGKLLGEKSNGLNSLGVAALMILGYDARQLFDVGFQLSFVAVLSIVYLYPIVNSWISPLRGGTLWRKGVVATLQVCAVSLTATLGTLPLTAVYFGRVSIVGLLTNIFIIPAVGASVILGFVSSLFGWFSFFIADSFAAVNQFLLKLSLGAAKFSGGLSWAYVDTLQFKPIHSIPFYAALGILFHLQLKHVARTFVVGFLASLNLLLFAPTTPLDKTAEGNLRVSFIDVGQGDAVLIEFPDGKTMLVDAGPKSDEYDAGERIVAPFLKRRGISTIDYLVASHPHGDHIGGFSHIFKKFEVKNVIENGQPARDPVYIEYAKAMQSERCNVDTARAQDSPLRIGGAKLYLLYPTPTFLDPDTTHPHHNLNNTSVVFKLCYGENSILFAGDAERDAEGEMVELYGGFLQSTILKTGHHGSITSSTQQFLDAVKPRHAIISVGLNNKFNHPSEEVLERLRGMNIETLRTDEDGAIIFESDGKSFQRIEWR